MRVPRNTNIGLCFSRILENLRFSGQKRDLSLFCVYLVINIPMNKFYVYAIVSEKDGVIYVGMTTDCEMRLKEHNAGKSKYTSGHLPWKLFYKEYIGESQEARKREKYFKSAAGKRRLKDILDKST